MQGWGWGCPEHVAWTGASTVCTLRGADCKLEQEPSAHQVGALSGLEAPQGDTSGPAFPIPHPTLCTHSALPGTPPPPGSPGDAQEPPASACTCPGPLVCRRGNRGSESCPDSTKFVWEEGQPGALHVQTHDPLRSEHC